MRAMAGLWPWGEGRIAMPAGQSLSFMPATPFLPAGSLREALTYPDAARGLREKPPCGPRSRPAARTRSPTGSTTCRAGTRRCPPPSASASRSPASLVQKPDIIIIEDALSPFDEASQAMMIDALIAGCPDSTIVMVGAKPSMAKRFDRFLSLQRSAKGGSILVETDAAGHPALTVVGGYEGRRDAAGTA